jgi:N-acetylneuraminate lyase
VGHNSLSEACQLAAHAQQIGATAISAVPPSYFKIDSTETLVACMAEIARGAPATPFYYYHVPHLTGVPLSMLDFLRTAGEKIPTLAGIKYTAPTLYEMQACLEFADRRFDILHGVDEMLLAGLAIGVRGAVGSTYNYAAPLYHRISKAHSRGDIETARLWQVRAIDMIRVILRHRSLAGQKAMMKLIGVDCGPTRLPVPGLTESEQASLHEELTAIGYFGWILAAE